MKRIILIIAFGFLFYSCKVQLLDQERTYAPKKSFTQVEQSIPVASSVFYFMRHVEPEKSESNNPHISSLGKKRVNLYLTYFKDKKIDTVFTTNLNRTLETATIIAKAKNVPIIFYDPFKINYKQFVKEHLKSSCLIVGHSNTTPDFVNKVINDPIYSQMDHRDHSSFYKVILAGKKLAVVEDLNLEKEIQKIEDSKLSPKELKKVLRERKKAAKK